MFKKENVMLSELAKQNEVVMNMNNSARTREALGRINAELNANFQMLKKIRKLFIIIIVLMIISLGLKLFVLFQDQPVIMMPVPYSEGLTLERESI